MPAVRLERLRYAYENGVPAVDDLSLELEAGEFFCLLGPSGCGKSTLLRLIGGYLPPTRGRIEFHGRDVTAAPPERRKAGMVFQSYALFPHLTALGNVEFGLRMQGVPKAKRLARAHEMLDWVGLSADERGRRPARLSGGQQQRVALARALAFEPELLMLDEPFANLDRLLRERLRGETRAVQRRAGITTILVTHDREEALSLGDRIGVMDRGRLLQVGPPEAVYHHPASRTVAEFLGHRNIIEAGRLEGLARIPLNSPGPRGHALLIWPDRLKLHEGQRPGAFPVTVEQAQFRGQYRVLTLRLAPDLTMDFHGAGDMPLPRPGEPRWLEIPPGAVTALPSPP